jgi:hypothetical protein
MTCQYHDYPYPTPVQATGAVMGLAQMAFDPASRDLACFLDCATTVGRFAASKGCCPDEHVSMESVEGNTAEEAAWNAMKAELACAGPTPDLTGLPANPHAVTAAPNEGLLDKIDLGKVLALVQLIMSFFKK